MSIMRAVYFIILCCMHFSHQVDLADFHRTINIFTEQKALIYAFNISILNRVISETSPTINKYCPSDIKHFETQLNRTLKDILTIENIFDNENDARERSIIRKTFYSLNNLENGLSDFSMSTYNEEKCQIYRKITSDLRRIYFYIERFSRSDYSLMDQIIDYRFIKNDTLKLLNDFYPRNMTIPINFHDIYAGDFFSHIKFKMQFHNQVLFLSFRIPIYEKIDKTNSFEFNTDESCFSAKNELFCKKPEYLNIFPVNDKPINEYSQTNAMIVYSLCIISLILQITVWVKIKTHMNRENGNICEIECLSYNTATP